MRKSLPEIIDAIETTIAELEFHEGRLKEQVEPEVESERTHLRNLKDDYARAARACGVLLNYQRGRLRRQTERREARDLTIEQRAYIDEENE